MMLNSGTRRASRRQTMLFKVLEGIGLDPSSAPAFGSGYHGEGITLEAH